MTMQPLDAARNLVPIAQRHRHDTEDSRRLAPVLVEAVVASRLGRLLLPESLRGLGATPLQALDVFEALAGAEASLSWIVWNNALPCLLARYLGESVRAKVFEDPDWLYASSTRPSGRAVRQGNTYEISGRWALVSGCELAEWIAFFCIVEEEGEISMVAPGRPEMRMVFLRRGEYRIEDTWHTGGLRGTGSHHVSVTARRVPADLTISLAMAAADDAPIHRLPIFCTMSAGFAAQVVGMARMALDTLVATARTKVTESRMPDLRDRPEVQRLVSGRSAALAAARGQLWSRMSKVWETSVDGRERDPAEIATLFSAALHAIDVARGTLDDVYAAVGTSALYVESPLERAHRDMHAMLRHIVAQPSWLEQAGRLEFELEVTEPMFVV